MFRTTNTLQTEADQLKNLIPSDKNLAILQNQIEKNEKAYSRLMTQKLNDNNKYDFRDKAINQLNLQILALTDSYQKMKETLNKKSQKSEKSETNPPQNNAPVKFSQVLALALEDELNKANEKTQKAEESRTTFAQNNNAAPVKLFDAEPRSKFNPNHFIKENTGLLHLFANDDKLVIVHESRDGSNTYSYYAISAYISLVPSIYASDMLVRGTEIQGFNNMQEVTRNLELRYSERFVNMNIECGFLHGAQILSALKNHVERKNTDIFDDLNATRKQFLENVFHINQNPQFKKLCDNLVKNAEKKTASSCNVM